MAVLPFDEYLAQATTDGPGRQRRLPGCVLAAVKDGAVYHKSFGIKSLDPQSPRFNEPLALDTCMWFASCTKLMTGIAALQCVEKGLLTLDDDISTILPEWKQRNILVGFDEATGAPLLEKTDEKLSLRMLLTHSSGLGYSFFDANFSRYIKYRVAEGLKVDHESLCPDEPVPLLFKPGTSWSYGIGTDWAGKMIERVTGLSLGSFMDQNIWQPLGMTLTTFRLQERAAIRARQADLTIRGADGNLSPHPDPFFPEDTPTDHGGGGVFTCTQDFIKVLKACATSDPKLLNSASYDLLCEPSLSATSAARLEESALAMSAAADAAAEEAGEPMVIPGPARMTWALGGQLTLEDVPGGRRAGSISWGGLPNLTWVVDRASGMAFLYASQVLPPGDRLSSQVVRRLEAEVYSGRFFEYAEAN